MLRIALGIAFAAVVPLTVAAGPKEEAQAVADKFVKTFIAGDLEATSALFAPDATFWGTVSPDLAVTPDGVRKYFADNYAARANAALKEASITDSSVQVLSDDNVLISGRWQVENARGSFPLRYTFVMQKKNGHNGGSCTCIPRHVQGRPSQIESIAVLSRFAFSRDLTPP